MGRATLPQTCRQMQRSFSSADLERLFAGCFAKDQNTVLVGGAEEPFYQPATAGQPAKIIYTRDYFRSALHEIAHWCVAGPARRKLADFGYWYAADGRDARQQLEFQQVEIKPQALELLFCAASAHPFRVSLDNLQGEAGDASGFEDAVWRRATWLLKSGVPGRAARWCRVLSNYYRDEPFSAGQIDEVFLRW
mgnify:FL=1